MTRKSGSNAAIWFFGALGGLLWGYDSGVIGGTLLFIDRDIPLTPLTQGLVVSGLLFGAMIGAFASGKVSDRLGRKPVLGIGGLVFIVGTVVASLAVSTPMLVGARVVLGLGLGLVSVTVPMYLSELAPAHIRGALSSLMQLLITTGICVAYVIDLVLSPTGAWRWMIALGGVPAVLLFVGSLGLPESPRWLVRSGSAPERALAVLSRLRRDPEVARAELAEIERDVASEARTTRVLKFGDIVSARLRPIFVVALLMVFFQNFGGINTVIYYAPTLLTNVGFDARGALLANAVIGFLNLLMTLPAMALVDRLGRRPLLLIGSAGMCAAMVFLATSTGTGLASGHNSTATAVTVTGVAVYVASFAMSWGPIQTVMLPELFPLSIRAGAVGLAWSLNWLFNLAVALVFPSTLARFGAAPNFGFFALMTALAFLFVLKLLPETKGRSLEALSHDLISQP
ncbi:sugar porter family MFS transporter [Brooklawnia cerclae]|uniref:Sugar porter (SP) family MFS transporter n=1 Tax=Brooklawnia cerclae TaxID=349934 RepID=A0ABX0SIX1_9ACTN|nr:sugar porter family MFS transporter [Brooklawnia cerclae]NIH57015.1 sugar porter (SP) family MFS transporter [Brooklawnia cerclae]